MYAINSVKNSEKIFEKNEKFFSLFQLTGLKLNFSLINEAQIQMYAENRQSC